MSVVTVDKKSFSISHLLDQLFFIDHTNQPPTRPCLPAVAITILF